MIQPIFHFKRLLCDHPNCQPSLDLDLLINMHSLLYGRLKQAIYNTGESGEEKNDVLMTISTELSASSPILLVSSSL